MTYGRYNVYGMDRQELGIAMPGDVAEYKDKRYVYTKGDDSITRFIPCDKAGNPLDGAKPELVKWHECKWEQRYANG